MKKKELLNKIKKIKSKLYGSIRIKCTFKKLKYDLFLLTENCITDKKIIRLLFLWRKKHEFWFSSQFKISFKGTEKWLKERVIETPDRLLFMIKVKDIYIGHIGLFRFNLKKNTCEIDNVIRGNPLYPGIIFNALNYLMKWGNDKLLLKSYTLETSSDNNSAIKLYKKLGFKEIKRVPLVQVNKKGYNEWIFAPKNFKGRIERYQVYMELIKN